MTEYMYIGLTVTGPLDEITRFRESVRGRDESGQEIVLDFARVLPIPQEITAPFAPLTEIDDVHYSPSWSERNWGSSSNALSTEVLEDKKHEISLGELAAKLGLDKSVTSRRVRDATDRGYLFNLETRRGRPARIVLAIRCRKS
jgi:hypothetical protein